LDWLALGSAVLTGGLLGFLGGLLTPWITWQVDQRRLLRERRASIIHSANETLNLWGSEIFLKSPAYSQLRRDLPEEIVTKIEHGRTFAVLPDGRSDADGHKIVLLDAIADLESKWRLR
jgi:hypothetical protein